MTLTPNSELLRYHYIIDEAATQIMHEEDDAFIAFVDGLFDCNGSTVNSLKDQIFKKYKKHLMKGR